MANTIHTVQGRKYEVWGDIISRATYAQDIETGKTKRIYGGGYITKDLTIRKAIANSFGLTSFRK